MRYLLDTDTCIDLLRGEPDVTAKADSVSPDDCAVSTVTTYELLAGAGRCRHPREEERKVATFVKAVHEIPFHRRAAERAGALRAELEGRGSIIGPYDLLLAGQALADGLVLVTSNTGEFSRVPGLRLERWRPDAPPAGGKRTGRVT